MGQQWPFVARSGELTQAQSALGGVPPRGLVLSGHAGVGKTRLARELLARSSDRGGRTHWVVATESTRTMPLGAFATVLGATSGRSDEIVVRAAQHLLGDPPPAASPVLVAVDDAHLLDELSALLVQHLALRTPAAVLLTVRADRDPPDALGALWRDDYLPRIDLDAFTTTETAALVEAALGGEVESSTVAELWGLSRGNPLFLRHLIEGEVRSGRLAQTDGLWRWTGEAHLTSGLIELVERRMGALSAGLTDVVDLLALAEPLPATLLADLTDSRTVETAEQRGLITVEPPPGLLTRLGHPLYGEVRRARMGQLRARRLRGRVAAALTPTEVTAADPLRRAVLVLDSDASVDAALFTDAALTAMRLIDFALAERLASSAARAGGGFVPSVTRAYALCFLHRGPESEAVFAELAATELDPTSLLTVALSRAANLLWEVGAPSSARQVLVEAERRLGVDPDGALASMRATVEGAVGRPAEARDRARRALAVPTIAPVATLAASYGLAGALGVLGQVTELEAVATRGYAAADRAAEVTFLRFGLAHLHLDGLTLAGEVGAAERLAARWTRETAAMPRLARLHSQGLAGQAALAHGRLQTARRQLTEVLRGLPSHPLNPFRYVVALHLVVALAKLGDAAEAGQVWEEVERHPHPAFGFLAPEALVGRAWVAAAEGSQRRALAAASASAEQARAFGQPAHEVLALQTTVALGAPADAARVADRLDELVTTVEGPRAPAVAAWARARGAGDVTGLSAASSRLEQTGDRVAAADAAAHAAAVLTTGGHPGPAAVAAGRAYALAQECEGARTPAVLAAARPLPLTARQVEVVALVGTGASNQEIADRLVVSVRTVEGHLYRAAERLGVSSRGELAAIFSGRHVVPVGIPQEIE